MYLRDEESTTRQGSAGLATLAICGEPVVGQALSLLLRGSGYRARFLSATSLWEPRALQDVRLLVLTPTPKLSTEYRDALLAALRERPETAKMPILELVTTPSEERPEQETGDESWYRVPWPCRIEELQRWIEAALSRHYGN